MSLDEALDEEVEKVKVMPEKNVQVKYASGATVFRCLERIYSFAAETLAKDKCACKGRVVLSGCCKC